MDTRLALDAVIVGTVAATLTTAAALVLSRSRRLSGHLRHQLIAYGIASALVVGAGAALLRPGPVGCLTGPCDPGTERARAASASFERFTLAGAGKDLGPVGAVAAPPPTSDDLAGIRAIALLLWICGVGVLGLRFGVRRVAAWRLLREAAPVDDPRIERVVARLVRRGASPRRLRLLRHPAVRAPAVGGALRPALFVPEAFERRPADEVEMVLLHELAHLRRRDPLVTLIGDLAAVLFWFHPLVWMARRRMRDLQELAADSHVLRGGVRPSRYAGFLVDAFRRMVDAPPVGLRDAHSILGDCLLDTRVRTILDAGVAHRRPSKTVSAAIATTFVVLCAVLTLAPASLQAAGLLTQEHRPRSGGMERELLTPAALDSVLRPVFIDYMADRYVAGAAIAVVHGGEIVYAGGFGRREVYHEVPVDPERTIFRIGSITKVMTGVAVLQLVERGLVDLDADVNRYLTRLRVPDAFGRPVLVRHLLTHTAGFDQIGLDRHVASAAEVRPLADFLSENLVRIRPPGEVSTYDTYGITLAGLLVEEVSGLPYERYLEENIFRPLGMHRTGITVPPSLEGDVAVGYEFRGRWFPMEWEFMNTDPASTVNSTVTDMARFALAMLGGGELDGARILEPSTVRAMLTRQYTNDPEQPGYGYTFWEDRGFGIPAWSHGGSMAGFGSLLYLVPEHDLGVYVAYTQESGGLAHAAVSALVDALFPEREGPRIRPRYLGSIDLSRFTGRYASSIYHHGDPRSGWRVRPFDITVEDGAIVFQEGRAYPVGPLAFQREDGVLLTFREGEGGDIEYLFVNQAVYERLGDPGG